MKWQGLGLAIVALCLTTDLLVADDRVPPYKPWTSSDSVKVISHRLVVRDGWYNAFPDLCLWKDIYWLSYRRGYSHAGRSSVSVVLRSTPVGGTVPHFSDLWRWQDAKVFEPPDGFVDGGSAHRASFVPTKDWLYAFIPAQKVKWGAIYMTKTKDGSRWSDPVMVRVGDQHPYVFRFRGHDGRFYGATCFMHNEGELKEGPLNLLVSDDGATWRKHAEIAPADGAGSPFTEESDLYWRSNGEVWCVVRTWSGAAMYWSKPPYTKWDGGVVIGRCDAPVICETAGKVYLAGRGPAKVIPNPSKEEQAGANGAPVLYHLTKGKAELLVSFPGGRDASYCGLVSPAPGTIIMTYYSDVAYQTRFVKPKHFPPYRYKYSDSDIYLAIIEVSG